jgi:uncharacterized membrane protein YgcG
MMSNKRYLVIVTAVMLTVAVFVASAGYAKDGVVAQEPELVVVRQGDVETCALPGSNYSELQVGDASATFLLKGQTLPAGHKRIAGHGIRKITWEPIADDTLVSVEFKTTPTFSLINAVDGTAERPGTPQVIAGFGFAQGSDKDHSYPVVGTHKPRTDKEKDGYGNYELPEFPPVKYSDARVTLKVENVDFRDVLWLMAEIGNISIILDPYWADEPTGSTRPPGGGADPGSGGGGGDGGGGFRGAGDFIPFAPRSGTGRLTLSFKNVPFDMALDLILMSVGLVKVDIYPGSLS